MEIQIIVRNKYVKECTCLKYQYHIKDHPAHLRSQIMVFSVRQIIWYVLQYSTILSADNENHDQAAWLHRPICARVGLISKMNKKEYIRKCSWT